MGMMRFLAFLGGAALLVLGCAEGGEADGSAGGFGGDFTGVGGFGGDDTTATTTSSTTSGDGGMGGMTGAGGMPNNCDFSATNTCQNAQILSPVSGDDGGSVGAAGTKSAWFHVHILETNSSIFAEDLSYTVTLQSPAGMDYDLVVRQGPVDGNVDCNATPLYGQGAGSTQTVSNKWNDNQPGDSSRWLAIEVIYVSGDDCINPWVLTVQGGT
jgi:hypothetical protein